MYGVHVVVLPTIKSSIFAHSKGIEHLIKKMLGTLEGL